MALCFQHLSEYKLDSLCTKNQSAHMKKKQSSARFEVIQDLYDNTNSQNQTYFKEQIKPPHHLQDSFPKAILYTTAQVADMELKLTVPEFSQETLHQVPFAECITLKILRLT